VEVKFDYLPGATPIDPDEAASLIPSHITLQRELNEFEEANILEAVRWLGNQRRGDPLDIEFIYRLHRRMFDQTWRWAGKARLTDKYIGFPSYEIRLRLREMLDDVHMQVEHQSYAPSEIAARYHHRLVTIHVFPNGNGRHARLMADQLLIKFENRRFEWGRDSLTTATETRACYIAALKAADAGDYAPLLAFLK
jgi:Fic-DOC domain mobile mystery protein B